MYYSTLFSISADKYLLNALVVMVVICYVENVLDPSQYRLYVSSGAQWYYNSTPKFLEKLKWLMARVPNS